MKKIKVDKYTYLNGSMTWRLGVRTAEKTLGGDVSLEDIDGYGPTLEWTRQAGGYVYGCKTNWKGELLEEYTYCYPWFAEV